MSRTPEEQKTLEATAAALAAGEDPFGDDEELVRELPGGDADANDTAAGTTTNADDDGAATTATAGAETQAATEAAAAATKKAEVLDESVLAEIADPLGLEQPTRFNAEPPKDYKVQRDALNTEKATAMKKLMDGEIDAEQYAAIESGIADKLETLMAQRIRAETLQEANAQNDAAYQQREIKKLIREAKAEIDYSTDAKAVKQFDQALAIIQADPDNAGRDYAELIGEAHRTVAALRGVQVKAPAATTAKPADTEPPDRTPKTEMPTTLRGLPSASTANTGGGVAESLSRLQGPEYEAAWSKLTPQQRAMMLDEA